MSVTAASLEALDRRLRILLPEQYQETYQALEPKPMRSAGLKFGADGKVAWDEIWQGFCDLAMAGGPPHKGALLEPGTRDDMAARFDDYEKVADEICRGIWMAAELPAHVGAIPGWVRVQAYSATMAGWLARAITMENVAVRVSGLMLSLPAAPHFRLEKEVKNVVTVIAKTAHYWVGHMSRKQKADVEQLFAEMETASPLVQPGDGRDGDRVRADLAGEAIQRATGFTVAKLRYEGWLGLECGSVKAALWITRALVAHNVLARREESVVFVPIDGAADPGGVVIVGALKRVHELAQHAGQT